MSSTENRESNTAQLKYKVIMKEKRMFANLSPIPELYVSRDSAQQLKFDASDLISWDLTSRQICDLELLMNGGFHLLQGFYLRQIFTALSKPCVQRPFFIHLFEPTKLRIDS